MITKKHIAIISILLGILINQWTLSFLSGKGNFSFITLWFIWLFQAVLLIDGIVCLRIKDRNKIFRIALLQFFAVSMLFAAAFSFEIYLKFSGWKYPDKSKLEIFGKYHEVINLDAHPLYYSFFDRKALKSKNDTVSIDGRGFRGVLPEEKGNKKYDGSHFTDTGNKIVA